MKLTRSCIGEHLRRGRRADGRGVHEVRNLFLQAGNISPALHRSGIFYRDDTHIFLTLTLRGPGSSQLIDTIESKNERKDFIHHYNFPPYSVGKLVVLEVLIDE